MLDFVHEAFVARGFALEPMSSSRYIYVAPQSFGVPVLF